jgi:nucleoside-diphosphate-sugar epimerase
VRDVVRANLLALDCPIADGRAINIGNGRNVTINRVAELIGGPTVNIASRPGDARHTLADNGEAARYWAGSPKSSSKTALPSLSGNPHLEALSALRPG